MFNLKRRIGESLGVGTNVSVSLPEVKGRQVKIEIHAPNPYPSTTKKSPLTLKTNIK
ncbi:carbon storage regulator [Microbulbifer epialgicus]|uniref:Carbon storage regulator n=1 Tax=Microbulbifer epialgicus TaxID=393907 RepID=A0ABV4P5M9_9GAMM